MGVLLLMCLVIFLSKRGKNIFFSGIPATSSSYETNSNDISLPSNIIKGIVSGAASHSSTTQRLQRIIAFFTSNDSNQVNFLLGSF